MEGQKPRIRYSSLLLGCALLILGLLMPLLLNVGNMEVYTSMYKAFSRDEKIYVLAAAFQLLLLNILRGYPNYLGAFFIADSFSTLTPRRYKKILLGCMVFPLVLLEYRLIHLLYGINYAFGVPALLTIAMMLVLAMVDLTLVSNIKKCFTVFFFHGAIQCLDVMPSLSGSFFGQGETTREIRAASAFLQADTFLNLSLLCVFILLALSACLYTVLVADENHIRLVSRQKEQREHELMIARMSEVENRTYREVYHVAHDLKTPLTSIQTIIGILALEEKEPRRLQLLHGVETSVEHMSRMITELLDETHVSLTTAGDILREVMAQVSIAPYVHCIELKQPAEDLYVNANRIRFDRMLINLLENAYYALTDHKKGVIRLEADRVYLQGNGKILSPAEVKNAGTPYVRFLVSDNGRGMDEKTVASIFQRGFSTRGSSGLGLVFVKEVVETHGGLVQVDSHPQTGTTFTILIPEEESDE
ncbi:MAG: HAMP domain-containing sensor histidine kinase [Eubacteriales bacterium]|nr:HAMP domain-containing sensor histidine kinase [Eubacteriales bacterium]MDY2983297.1 HAMP domain-containing sensor histidine kinase [Eubacteriales bacterium]